MNIRARLTPLLVLGCSLTLPACDDDGGSGEFENGYYIDNFVSGVTYITEDQGGGTREGKTGEDNDPGLFKYLNGKTVEFKLGDTDLGQSLGKPRVTPFDLAGVDEMAVGGCDVLGELPDDDFRKVQNHAVLLQTFDDDGDPSNNISISPAVATLFDNVAIDLDQPWVTFSADAELVLKEANDNDLFPDTRNLRDRRDALRALYQGIELCPAEGCADADIECADCEMNAPESDRCLGAVVVSNFLEPSECQALVESSEPARDCGGAGGTGGIGGTAGTGGSAGGGGMGGTPSEGCADSEVLCADCEVDTSEWEICLGGVFLCNELVEPMECPACVDLLQPGCDGAGGTGGSGGAAGTGGGGGFPPPGVVCVLCTNELSQEACEARWNECVADPPSENALEKCVVFALGACIEIEL